MRIATLILGCLWTLSIYGREASTGSAFWDAWERDAERARDRKELKQAKDAEKKYTLSIAQDAKELLGGELEVTLKDGTRYDLLTDTHVYEIEYDSDWKESIGQSLHYAHVTGRKAGVVLIMRSSRSHGDT